MESGQPALWTWSGPGDLIRPLFFATRFYSIIFFLAGNENADQTAQIFAKMYSILQGKSYQENFSYFPMKTYCGYNKKRLSKSLLTSTHTIGCFFVKKYKKKINTFLTENKSALSITKIKY